MMCDKRPHDIHSCSLIVLNIVINLPDLCVPSEVKNSSLPWKYSRWILLDTLNDTITVLLLLSFCSLTKLNFSVVLRSLLRWHTPSSDKTL